MATKQTAVAKAVSQEVGFSQETPEWAKSGQGRGSENVGTKDIVLPRLEIVQSQSPIKDTDETIREGMLFNSATSENLGDTAFIVPIYYRMEYLVWKDQDEGGGFFGSYDTEHAARARIQEEVSNGESESLLEVVDTPVHYCLRVRSDFSTEQIVISMPKSKAKVSRKWNSLIQIAGGDRFSRVYKLGTFKDKNKKNQAFHNFTVQPAGFPPEAVYREAERLYDVFKTQGVKADHATGGDGEGTAGMDTDPI
jgi:hypothetical protein